MSKKVETEIREIFKSNTMSSASKVRKTYVKNKRQSSEEDTSSSRSTSNSESPKEYYHDWNRESELCYTQSPKNGLGSSKSLKKNHEEYIPSTQQQTPYSDELNLNYYQYDNYKPYEYCRDCSLHSNYNSKQNYLYYQDYVSHAAPSKNVNSYYPQKHDEFYYPYNSCKISRKSPKPAPKHHSKYKDVLTENSYREHPEEYYSYVSEPKPKTTTKRMQSCTDTIAAVPPAKKYTKSSQTEHVKKEKPLENLNLKTKLAEFINKGTQTKDVGPKLFTQETQTSLDLLKDIFQPIYLPLPPREVVVYENMYSMFLRFLRSVISLFRAAFSTPSMEHIPSSYVVDPVTLKPVTKLNSNNKHSKKKDGAQNHKSSK